MEKEIVIGSLGKIQLIFSDELFAEPTSYLIGNFG